MVRQACERLPARLEDLQGKGGMVSEYHYQVVMHKNKAPALRWFSPIVFCSYVVSPGPAQNKSGCHIQLAPSRHAVSSICDGRDGLILLVLLD